MSAPIQALGLASRRPGQPIITILIANGRSALLIGPTTPEDWSETELADTPTECAYLDRLDDVIEVRLRARGAAVDDIADELQFLAQLRSSDYTAITLDTQTPEQVAKQVATWVRNAGTPHSRVTFEL